MKTNDIRNFCIIAHIDHGKSTLADRFLQMTSTLSDREMTHGQMLDTMDLEQERGITIKLQPVKMLWKDKILNLIDTPGHVDFSYEVSRSLAACEGAILVIDATQGIQAQTLATVYAAMEHDLTIIPVINKIDLPNSDVETVKHEIIKMFGFKDEEILTCSAKTGLGIENVLDKIIELVPSPKESEGEAKALIFDAVYDSFRGVVAYVKMVQGQINKSDKLFLLGSRTYCDALDIGYLKPGYEPSKGIPHGDIGYIVTGLKELDNVRVGDTLTVVNKGLEKEVEPLPGYEKVTPVVFAGIFCTDTSEYVLLRKALTKLKINDSSLIFEPKHSDALGFGFHCGFLGLLHMEIVQERLEREFDLDLIITAPSVSYEVVMKDKSVVVLSSASEMPDPGMYDEVREPWVKSEIVVPKDYVGNVMKLCEEKDGVYLKIDYIDEGRVVLDYELPLRTIVMDFYDSLKSATSGYASFSYEIIGYRKEDLVKMDILVAGDVVDSLSLIVPRKYVQASGRVICKKLKEVIPKHLFRVSLQAAVGGKIVAREDISAMSKDVTAKLYGGDVTRKNKLRKKQAKGKKRMKQFGKVQIPQKAFLSLLDRN